MTNLRSPHRPSLTRYVILIGGISLAFFLGIASLTWPMDDDQAHYSFVGDIVVNGGVPYRDAWDLKGPLTYYLYGTIRRLVGHNELSIRVFDLGAISLFCWQLRLLVLRLNGYQSFGAIFAVLVFLICYFGGGYCWTAQPDGWSAMLLLVAVSALLNETGDPYLNVLIAGVFLSAAILLKPTYIIFIPLLSLPSGQHTLISYANIKRFFAGLLLVALLVSTFYLWIFRSGGFKDLIDIFRFISEAYRNISERLHPSGLMLGLSNLYDLGLAIPYALVPVGLWAMSQMGLTLQARMLGAWFVLSIVMLLYQGVYWYYEYASATISTVVIISVSLKYAERWDVASLARRGIDGVLLVIVGAACLAPLLSNTIFGSLGWPKYVLGLEGETDYVVRISNPDDSRYAVEGVAAYLSTHTDLDDKVQLWGFGLAAIILSQRTAASRFGDSWPLMEGTSMRDHYRRVFMREILSSIPRCIVVDTNAEPVKSFPEFERFISRYYVTSRRISKFQIWTLQHTEKAQSLAVDRPSVPARHQREGSLR